MILYPDCDFFGDRRDDQFAPGNTCDGCYRWDTCIRSWVKEHKPIPVEKLPEYIGKHIWVQSPGIPEYGREAEVEDVDVEHGILWLVNDFTCHQYGTIWEAYSFEG